MSLEGVTEEQLAEYEKTLLAEVTAIEDGGRRAGNITLQRKLKEKGWPEDQYWEIRDRLVDRNLLERGTGKGGSVRSVKPTAAPPQPVQAGQGQAPAQQNPPQAAGPAVRLREGELYESVAETLKSAWVKDRRYGAVLLEVTARQGKRETGGKWTRPDIALATMTTLLYVPGKVFDVVTFEVKPSDAIDVTAVYEALAHRRAATRSYVWLYLPDPVPVATQQAVDAVVSEAKRHGIGVISASVPTDYETWEELVEATRADPDPLKLNDFITVQFSAGNRDELLKWMR